MHFVTADITLLEKIDKLQIGCVKICNEGGFILKSDITF